MPDLTELNTAKDELRAAILVAKEKDRAKALRYVANISYAIDHGIPISKEIVESIQQIDLFSDIKEKIFSYNAELGSYHIAVSVVKETDHSSKKDIINVIWFNITKETEFLFLYSLALYHQNSETRKSALTLLREFHQDNEYDIDGFVSDMGAFNGIKNKDAAMEAIEQFSGLTNVSLEDIKKLILDIKAGGKIDEKKYQITEQQKIIQIYNEKSFYNACLTQSKKIFLTTFTNNITNENASDWRLKDKLINEINSFNKRQSDSLEDQEKDFRELLIFLYDIIHYYPETEVREYAKILAKQLAGIETSTAKPRTGWLGRISHDMRKITDGELDLYFKENGYVPLKKTPQDIAAHKAKQYLFGLFAHAVTNTTQKKDSISHFIFENLLKIEKKEVVDKDDNNYQTVKSYTPELTSQGSDPLETYNRSIRKDKQIREINETNPILKAINAGLKRIDSDEYLSGEEKTKTTLLYVYHLHRLAKDKEVKEKLGIALKNATSAEDFESYLKNAGILRASGHNLLMQHSMNAVHQLSKELYNEKNSEKKQKIAKTIARFTMGRYKTRAQHKEPEQQRITIESTFSTKVDTFHRESFEKTNNALFKFLEENKIDLSKEETDSSTGKGSIELIPSTSYDNNAMEIFKALQLMGLDAEIAALKKHFIKTENKRKAMEAFMEDLYDLFFRIQAAEMEIDESTGRPIFSKSEKNKKLLHPLKKKIHAFAEKNELSKQIITKKTIVRNRGIPTTELSFERGFVETAPDQDKLANRSWKEWILRAAIAITIFVAISEGVIGAVLGGGPIGVVILLAFGGFITNGVLLYGANRQVLTEIFLKGIFNDENGVEISPVKKLAVSGALLFSVATGAACAALTYNSMVLFLVGFGLTSSIAAGPAGFIAFMVLLSFTALFHTIISDFIKNRRATQLKNYLSDIFILKNIRTKSASEIAQHIGKCILNALLMTLGIAAVAIISVGSMGLLHSKSVLILQHYAKFSAGTSNILSTVLVKFLANTINTVLYVKNLPALFITLGDGIWNFLKGLWGFIKHPITTTSGAWDRYQDWRAKNSASVIGKKAVFTVFRGVLLIAAVFNAYGYGSGMVDPTSLNNMHAILLLPVWLAYPIARVVGPSASFALNSGGLIELTETGEVQFTLLNKQGMKMAKSEEEFVNKSNIESKEEEIEKVVKHPEKVPHSTTDMFFYQKEKDNMKKLSKEPSVFFDVSTHSKKVKLEKEQKQEKALKNKNPKEHQ